MNKQHYFALGLLLAAVSTQIASLTNWQEATHPVFVAGVLGAVASVLTAIYSDKPEPKP